MFNPLTTIDTNTITAFGATIARNENIWVALSTPDGRLLVYTSLDRGNSWQKVVESASVAPARQIEMVAGNTHDSPVFIFYLSPDGDGDLYLLRLFPASGVIQTVAVAVGPDTIDRVSVATDRDSNYYLYCLYVNEQRTGRNGYFTRSRDQGSTWEAPQGFWNCFHPSLSSGAGSLLHCVWRYALSGREIHYSANPYYGAPGRWRGLSVLKSGYEQCFYPAVVQTDTFPPWRAPVWAVWTVARRDTEMLDLEFTFSTSGGSWWFTPDTLGEMFIDEWLPVLLPGRWNVDMVYNAGGRGENDPTVLYWCSARSYLPQTVSAPRIVNDRRVQTNIYGARARLVPLRWRHSSFPAVIFSAYQRDSARGLLFSRTILSGGENHNINIGRLAPVTTILTPAKVTSTGIHGPLFDATGKMVAKNNLRPGIYFSSTDKSIKKIVFLR